MKKSLLVGLNEYQYQPTLTGCLNDVGAFKKLLVDYYEFDPVNILTLVNSQANTNQVSSALDWLFTNSREEEDDLFFFYSGHGSYVHDFSGDEADQKDEIFALYDHLDFGKEYQGGLLDDELTKRVLKCSQNTLIEIVVDACHSGTIVDVSQEDLNGNYWKVPQCSFWTAATEDQVARVQKNVDQPLLEKSGDRGSVPYFLTEVLKTEKGRSKSRQELFKGLQDYIANSPYSQGTNHHDPTCVLKDSLKIRPFLER